MKLVFEVEFLTGVCRAAIRPSSSAPDWPPQTDRVFSALVAAWGMRGEQRTERDALEWLERQPPPSIHASGCEVRTAPDVFVPPNDLRYSRSASAYLKVLPQQRPRQPRTFPAARPYDSVMSFVWGVEPDADRLASLDAIARDVSYIGHPASLVRCRFRSGHPSGQHPAATSRDRVYKGRLSELVRAHAANPIRPNIPSTASNFELADPDSETSVSFLVLEVIRGEVPDIRASALVCREIRRTLMSGYRRVFGAEHIPEIVSGHSSDGQPTRVPHLMIAPMAFVGHKHADGRVFGFVLIPPKSSDLLNSDQFKKAFKAVAKYDEGEERLILKLFNKILRVSISLAPANAETKKSLSFVPYWKSARIWASVTPIVLDRHLKRHDEEEVRELLAAACQHAGLPKPEMRLIQAGKHSSVNGAPPARPLAGEPPWAAWRIPKSLETRSLTHVVIDFQEEVTGPVLLGAGRFTGLGLCRGLEGQQWS